MVAEISEPDCLSLPPSWRPFDLTEVLSGDYKPLKPSIGARSDGPALLYPAKTHIVSSEPEGGKSWFALHICKQEMCQGNPVIYIDYEDDAAGVVGRLRAMGLPVEMIREKFVYIRPETELGTPDTFYEYVRGLNATFVVIDGVTEAMSMERLSIVDNQDAADFFALLPTPMSRLGPAVLLLDHEVKRAGDRGRFGIGAGHKLAAISGAAFKLINRSPFGVGITGESELIVVKDRPGQLRNLSANRDGVLGALRVESFGTDLVEVLISPEFEQIRRADHLEQLMEEVSATMVKEFPDGMSTKGDIKHKIHKNGQLVGKALNELIDRGHVSSSKPYQVVKKYKAGDADVELPEK